MIRPTSRTRAIVALGVAGLALAIGAVILLVGSESSDDGDTYEASGPVGIRERGPRSRPSVDVSLELRRPGDPMLEAAVTERYEVVRAERGDDAPAATYSDLLTAAVVRQRALDHAVATVRRRTDALSPPTTTNPNDIDVTGFAIAADPGTPAMPGLAVEAGPPGTDPRDPVLGTPSANPKNASPSPAIVEAGLPAEVVRRYLRRAMGPIRACYEAALLTRPGLEGTVRVTFTIGTDGLVSSAAASGMDDGAAACIAGVIRGLEFPRPDGDGVVTVRYPFVFRPAT